MWVCPEQIEQWECRELTVYNVTILDDDLHDMLETHGVTLDCALRPLRRATGRATAAERRGEWPIKVARDPVAVGLTGRGWFAT